MLIGNATIASSVLRLLARIFNSQQNLNYKVFERVLQSISPKQLLQCNFGQFFGSSTEEKSVILIVDSYSRRELLNQRKTLATKFKPVNVFKNEEQYEYFVEIYERWKEQSVRNRDII